MLTELETALLNEYFSLREAGLLCICLQYATKTVAGQEYAFGQAEYRSGLDFGLPCSKVCGSVSFFLQEDAF